MADDTESPPPRPQQAWRSTASSNWRVKDDAPRPEQPARTRPGRNQEGQQNTNTQSYSRNSSSQQLGNDAATPGARLYVGNLLYTAQRADVELLFSNSGFTVVGVSISTDPFTGRNPSYCFVDVDSAEEAQRAISELNGADLLGRQIRVSPGVAKKQSQGSGAAVGSETRVKDYERGSGRPQGVPETRERKDENYNPTFDRWNRTDAPAHWTAPQAEGRRLYFGNMPRIEPQSAHDQEVQALFAQYAPGVEVTAVSKQISPRPGPEPARTNNQYYCFVDLQKGDDVDAVIEAIDGKAGSWGGNVKVSRARNSDRKVVKEQGLQGQERKVVGEGTWRRSGAPAAIE